VYSLLQTLVNGLATGAIYSLVATSLALIVQACRFVHFAIGGLMAIGACCFYEITKQLGLGPFVGAGVALSAGAFVGVLTEVGIFRYLRFRNAGGLVLMIASLGLLVTIEGVLGLVFGREPLVLRTGAVVPAIFIGGIRLTLNQLLCIASALMILLGLMFILRFMTLGKSLRALANDPALAFSTGVPIRWITFASFAICGAVAAWIGVLVGLEQEATPGMGFRPLLMGVAGMVIGGQSRLFSAALGGLVVGIVQHLAGSIISGGWQDTVVFALLFIVLFLHPSGLFGRKPNLSRV
jgi:branched-subunit amino acid ABC-type transport system permease component